MKKETFDKITELLNEREKIAEALPYKHIGVSYGDSAWNHQDYTVRLGERTEELLREALEKRLDEIKDKLKELGLED